MPLKLIHRTSDYDFPDIQGRALTPAEKEFLPNAIHDQRIVSVQLIRNDSGGRRTTGCCQCTKRNRVVVLREMNFVSVSAVWEVFVLPSRVVTATSTHCGPTCLHVVLLPSAISRLHTCQKWNKWKYLGACRASVLSMDLEVAIGKYVHGTGQSTARVVATPKCHWHMDVFIDSIVDDTLQWASKSLWQACEPPTRKNTGMKPSAIANVPLFIAKHCEVPVEEGGRSCAPRVNGASSSIISIPTTDERKSDHSKEQKGNSALVHKFDHETSPVPAVTYASITKASTVSRGIPNVAVGSPPLVLANRTNCPKEVDVASPFWWKKVPDGPNLYSEYRY